MKRTLNSGVESTAVSFGINRFRLGMVGGATQRPLSPIRWAAPIVDSGKTLQDRYAPPTAPLTDPSQLQELRQRSILTMIVLAIVTLGGYLVYWYIATTRTLNQRVTVARISPLFMAVCVLMTIANLAIAGVLGWGEGAATPFHRLQEAESIVNTADLVLGLIWALRIRYSLNLTTGVQKPSKIW